MKRCLGLSFLVLASSALSFVAHGHSTLEAATPKNGSVLTQSPASIEVKFKDAVQLTSVMLVLPDGTKRKLTFTPATSAQQFSIAAPELANGRNELQWKALSRDGHVLSGSLAYVVKPPVANAGQ